jgi:hypothetical protein
VRSSAGGVLVGHVGGGKLETIDEKEPGLFLQGINAHSKLIFTAKLGIAGDLNIQLLVTFSKAKLFPFDVHFFHQINMI